MSRRATGSFLVRVWVEENGPASLTGQRRTRFRGQVKDLKTGDSTLVADPESLMAVLTESLRAESLPELHLVAPAENGPTEYWKSSAIAGVSPRR